MIDSELVLWRKGEKVIQEGYWKVTEIYNLQAVKVILI